MKKAFRWIGTVVGLLVFVALVLIGVGTSLPVEHHSTCSTDLKTPVHQLWTTVYDVGDSSWRPEITRVEQPAPGAASDTWVEVDRYGHSIKFERVSAEPDHRLEIRIADQTAPFGGTWTYEFSPQPAGTRVSIAEDGQIYNPVFRLVSRYVMGYSAPMRAYLTDLGKHFGQSPAVDCTDMPPQ